MSVTWSRYEEAYKAIHDKIAEVLAKLDNPADPQVANILNAITVANAADLKRITRIEFPEVFPVSNLGQIINGDFEIAITGGLTTHIIPGWIVGNGASIDSGFRFTGFKSVCLKDPGGPEYFKCIWQIFSPSIPTKYIRNFSLMYMNYEWDPYNLYVKLFYSDGTFSLQTESMPADWDWHKLDLTYNAEKFIVAIHVWTNCTYASSIFVDTISLNYKATLEMPITFLSGQKTVTTAGTPVTLGSGAILHSVLIQPMPTNTGNIKVGNSSSQNFILTPTSAPIRVFAEDLGDIYIDSTDNGEGVNYVGG